MLKDYFWKTFENTGHIQNYMFYRELDSHQKKIGKNETASEEVAMTDSHVKYGGTESIELF